MKQLRWVWVLAVTAVLLVVVFIFVDHRSRKQAEEASVGEPKQLLLLDIDTVTRITIDNEDGHFAFDWQNDGNGWKLVSQEQFKINQYGISAICTYLGNVRSEKTVAFDCKDTAVYGFDHPVTLKVYTTYTDDEHPYVLYIGDSTPTYDAYYAMVDGSNDVYTIDYTSGSIFCASKDALKNNYLYDVSASQINYYRLERDGKVVTEISRDADNVWQLDTPAGYEIYKVRIDDLMNTLIRVQFSGFVEEDPADLAQYGLDKPHTKLFLSSDAYDEEVWFGSSTSESENAQELFGYLTSSKQVFRVVRNDISFTQLDPSHYILPYCINVSVEELSAIEIDMGDVYEMHTVMHLDYANTQYALDDTDITALDNETTMGLFMTFFRTVSLLAFDELDLEAEPDPESEPVIRIIYTYLDGHTTELDFVEKAENNYYLMRDGVYTGMTVRLNRFTGSGCAVDAYEALMQALK